MSNIVIPNVAKVELLERLVGSDSDVPEKLRLFQNNLTIGPTTVLSDFTQANFSGYVAGTLTGVSVSGTLDSDNRAVATWSDITFTKSGATGNTIWGYYVTNNMGGFCWAEKFDSPVVLDTDGEFLTITPKFTLKSQFSNA
jgi:hypothetical protein